MNRYFTNKEGSAHWRVTPAGEVHIKTVWIGEWSESIFTSLDDMLDELNELTECTQEEAE